MGNQTSTVVAQAGVHNITTEQALPSHLQAAVVDHAQDDQYEQEQDQYEQEQYDTPSEALRKDKDELRRELEAARPGQVQQKEPASADVRRQQFRAYKEQAQEGNASATSSQRENASNWADKGANIAQQKMNVKDLLLHCDAQIPDITDAPDFDPRNPEHLRAFEEEMIEMMTGALEKQARIQRTKRVVNSARGKLTEHEIDLATRGLDVPQVRQAQAVAAFERSELQAGRDLPRNTSTPKGKKALSSADGSSSHKASSHHNFPSRAAEGEYMSTKVYTDKVKGLKKRLEKAGSSYADYARALQDGLHVDPHLRDHNLKPTNSIVKQSALVSRGARMFRKESVSAAKTAEELKGLKAAQQLAALKMDAGR